MVAALALSIWVLSNEKRLFGIVWDQGWWWRWASSDIIWLLVEAPPPMIASPVLVALVFATLESVAALSPLPGVARVVAVVYVLVAGYAAAVALLLRLPGVELPVQGSQLMLFLYSLWLSVGLQVLLTAAGIHALRYRLAGRVWNHGTLVSVVTVVVAAPITLVYISVALGAPGSVKAVVFTLSFMLLVLGLYAAATGKFVNDNSRRR